MRSQVAIYMYIYIAIDIYDTVECVWMTNLHWLLPCFVLVYRVFSKCSWFKFKCIPRSIVRGELSFVVNVVGKKVTFSNFFRSCTSTKMGAYSYKNGGHESRTFFAVAQEAIEGACNI